MAILSEVEEPVQPGRCSAAQRQTQSRAGQADADADGLPYDRALASLLRQHDGRPMALLDSVLDFLARRSDAFKEVRKGCMLMTAVASSPHGLAWTGTGDPSSHCWLGLGLHTAGWAWDSHCWLGLGPLSTVYTHRLPYPLQPRPLFLRLLVLPSAPAVLGGDRQQDGARCQAQVFGRAQAAPSSGAGPPRRARAPTRRCTSASGSCRTQRTAKRAPPPPPLINREQQQQPG